MEGTKLTQPAKPGQATAASRDRDGSHDAKAPDRFAFNSMPSLKEQFEAIAA
jgi:hypothetical protein